jgi:hypothetical protein
MLMVPFRVFGFAARPVASGSGRPLGIGCSFRVPRPLQYHPYWLGDPTLPLAIPSALWFSHSGLRWSQSSVQSSPLFEFRLPPECCPTNPSRSAAAVRLLSWALAPFSTSRLEGPLAAGFAWPATFRLQGLVTLLTAYSLRTPAGFVSRRRRSWDSPFGAFPSQKVSGAFPPGSTHLPSFHPVEPHAEGKWPARGPRFLGFDPFESPWQPETC